MINININMIAERRSRRIRELSTVRMTILITISVTVLMALWNVINWFNLSFANKQLTMINNNLKAQNIKLVAYNQIVKEIDAKQPLVVLLKRVQNSECAWMTVFGDLSKITPPGVVLSSQSSSGSDKGLNLQLSGKVADESTFADFMLGFSQHTKWAGQPSFQSFSATGDKNSRLQYAFTLEIPIKGMVGGGL